MTDHDEDDIFLQSLRRTVQRIDAVPTEVVDFACASLAFLDLDSELGQIIDDSLLVGAAVPVRSTATATRQLAVQFAGGSQLSLYLDDSMVVGQFEPAEGGVVRVVQADDERETALDEFGEFVLHTSPKGPFRVELCLDSGRSLVTEWLLR